MASRLFVAACLLGFVACGGGGGSDKGTVPDVPVTTDPEVEDPGTVPPEDPGSPDDPGVPVDVPSPEDTLTTDPGQPDPGEPDPGQPDPGQPDPGQPDVPTTPPGHTEDDGGAMHKPGKNDPLKNCVSCHGSKLTGGTGPSCYSCHNDSDHTKKYGGVKHKSGSSSTCKACHGPSNNGGLGPACSKCH